jgi:hypothetical protein
MRKIKCRICENDKLDCYILTITSLDHYKSILKEKISNFISYKIICYKCLSGFCKSCIKQNNFVFCKCCGTFLCLHCTFIYTCVLCNAQYCLDHRNRYFSEEKCLCKACYDEAIRPNTIDQLDGEKEFTSPTIIEKCNTTSFSHLS